MSTVSIINKSHWPTPAVEIIARWVARAAGITWDYTVHLGHTNRRGWYGHGWKYRQESYMDRHYRRGKPYWGSPTLLKHHITSERLWPYIHKDHRFQWSEDQTFRSRLEILVYLIAHEATHATTGHPSEYRGTDGRKETASMEFHCNARGYRILEKFREAWPKIRPLIYAAMRKTHQRQTANIVKHATRRPDPAPKLALAQKRIKEWTRKKKFAETKIRKYTRRIRYYERKVQLRPTAVACDRKQ